MKAEYSLDDEQFRLEIRAWFQAEFPAFRARWDGPADASDHAFRLAWETHICEQGWSGLDWPERFGGKGWPLARQAIFHEEHARVGAPLGFNSIGHGILGPTLVHFGSPWQCDRFLPEILANREIWCQGYSEPGAGSDLASLRTRATRVGGGYRLNGVKIWTSWAMEAHWCFVLARTDPDAQKHKGISFFLVDMKSPGVLPEPIRQITGEPEFNEVRFVDVFVPENCLVGQEGEGWRMAMAAANFERGTYFIPRVVRFRQEVEALAHLAREAGRGTISARVGDALARLKVDAHLLTLKAYRSLAQSMRGEAPGPEGSAVKIHWSEAHQRLLSLAMQMLGPRALLDSRTSPDRDAARWTRNYLWSRAETILAGTSEIQRNVVADKLLGLPRN